MHTMQVIENDTNDTNDTNTNTNTNDCESYAKRLKQKTRQTFSLSINWNIWEEIVK